MLRKYSVTCSEVSPGEGGPGGSTQPARTSCIHASAETMRWVGECGLFGGGNDIRAVDLIKTLKKGRRLFLRRQSQRRKFGRSTFC